MAIYEFEGKIPRIGQETYVSESADVIGNVTIGEECYIGPGAKIKGDYGTVRIGSRTNIQENCVLHARPDEILSVGNEVTVGHGSILHNCTVKNFAVIGMGAIISDYAEIGEWCAVGEGAVVKQNDKIPDGKVVVGIPAKVIGEVTKEWKELWGSYKKIYVELAKRYIKSLKKIK